MLKCLVFRKDSSCPRMTEQIQILWRSLQSECISRDLTELWTASLKSVLNVLRRKPWPVACQQALLGYKDIQKVQRLKRVCRGVPLPGVRSWTQPRGGRASSYYTLLSSLRSHGTLLSNDRAGKVGVGGGHFGIDCNIVTDIAQDKCFVTYMTSCHRYICRFHLRCVQIL